MKVSCNQKAISVNGVWRLIYNVFITFVICLTVFPAFAQSSDFVPGQILVKMKSDRSASRKAAFKTALKASELKTFSNVEVELWEIEGALAKADIETIIQQYASHPDLEFIEPNYLYSTTMTTPNDPMFGLQWNLHNIAQNGGTAGADIDATLAWSLASGSPEVVVAVIDAGIDWTHEDLVDNIWQNMGEDADGDGQVLEWNGTAWVFDTGDENGIDDDGNGYVDDFVGWDFRNNDNNPYGTSGHGTHVSGIIGASGDNNIGIAGVSWKVQLAGLKFLSDFGYGTTADAVEALNYAVSMGMPISNNSWGGGPYSTALSQAIQNAETNNHLMITAAGNDYGNDNDIAPRYPASYDHPNIISVTSTDQNDGLSGFSNFGATNVDIAAPGSLILSCFPGDTYQILSGTSMAAPHVAGTAALLKGIYPDMPYSEIKEAILNSVENSPALNGKCSSNGRLNVYNAINYYGSPLSGNCRANDSLILVNLYNTTNGANWINTWNLNDPMDEWYGLILNQSGCVDTLNLNINNLTGTLPTGIGNLTQPRGLHFGKNNLEGTIPAELGNLTTLVGLNLADNNFIGSVPVELFALTELTFLAFTGNQLTGALPQEIGNLINMKYLYIGKNDLSGSLPPEIGNLTDLRTFQMRETNISGSLPASLNNLDSLTYVDMARNNLTGNIPAGLSTFNNLTNFYCHYNQFTFDSFDGLSIPPSFYYAPQDSIPLILNGNDTLSVNAGGNLTDNTYKWYKNGSLVDNITGNPTYIVTEPGTYSCEVTNNLISNPFEGGQNLSLHSRERYVYPFGELPCRIHDSLILVALYNSTDGANWDNTWNLNDPIDEWYGLTLNPDGCLDTLNLNINNLTGTLPAEIGNLTGPRGLHFGRNNLEGPIPSSLGNLSTLVGLNLADNNFTGSVPVELFNLTELTFLAFTGNPLTGALPPEIGNLINMRYLYIGNTSLSGPFPPEIGNLTEMIILQMRNSDYSGPLPETFANMTNLNYLDISNNNFTGVITPDLSDPTNSTEFYCHYNKFTFDSFDEDTIPDYYFYAPQDSIFLIVNGNTLSVDAGGLISDNTYTWYKDNTIFSTIAGDSTLLITTAGRYRCEVRNDLITNPLGYGQNLVLSSRERQLYPVGSQPCRQADSLVLVNLYNSTTGLQSLWNLNQPMSTWIGITLSQDGCVSTLNLIARNVCGSLPDDLGNLANLSILNLEQNCLTGNIPLELSNLTNLVHLNLSNNQFVGNIPIELSNLSNLVQLNVADNQLSGTIPTALSNLSNLTYLNLADNELSGSIPTELGDLSELTSLYLNNNQLTGSLPTEFGSLNSLIYLYLNNNQLTGNIPLELGSLSSLNWLNIANNQLSGCYSSNLSNLCNQLSIISNTNAYISDGNNFDSDWEIFCNDGTGICPELVWPGDFNHDGIADNNDVLYWGLAEGNTGTTRPNASTSWTGQESPEWSVFVDGINGKHQDADGNGLVDAQDLQVLVDNYANTHNFSPQAGAYSSRDFKLELLNIAPNDSNTVLIEYALSLESSGQAAIAHGASCSIEFGQLQLQEANLNVSGSSLQPQESMHVLKTEENALDIALTRTDRNDRVCNGPIVTIQSIVIVEDVPTGEPFSIHINDGNRIIANGDTEPVNSSSLYGLWTGNGMLNNGFVPTVSVTHEQCGILGTASVQVTGGIMPYTYAWNTGETSADINNLSAGSYTVTVSDAVGFSTAIPIIVEGQFLPIYDEAGNLIDCNTIACPTMLSPTGLLNSSYQVGTEISSDGTVPAGENTSFKAGQSILLDSGFSILPGATFSAEIEDCGGN